MVQVKCIKTVTLGVTDIAYLEGNEYDVPAKQADDYSEYFERIVAKKAAKPKTKKQETEENK